MADKTDYLWDPEWSHILFFIVPKIVSSTSVATVSLDKDYLKLTPLITNTTHLKFDTLFNDRTSNNSFNSTI